MESLDPAAYLTITEAAKLLRVGRRTLYNYMKTGKLKYAVTPSGRRRLRVDDLMREGPELTGTPLVGEVE